MLVDLVLSSQVYAVSYQKNFIIDIILELEITHNVVMSIVRICIVLSCGLLCSLFQGNITRSAYQIKDGALTFRGRPLTPEEYQYPLEDSYVMYPASHFDYFEDSEDGSTQNPTPQIICLSNSLENLRYLQNVYYEGLRRLNEKKDRLTILIGSNTQIQELLQERLQVLNEKNEEYNDQYAEIVLKTTLMDSKYPDPEKLEYATKEEIKQKREEIKQRRASLNLEQEKLTQQIEEVIKKITDLQNQVNTLQDEINLQQQQLEMLDQILLDQTRHHL